MTITEPVDSMTDEFPWMPWANCRRTVDKMWDPLNTPHHSIIGLTGSGKSYLAINGILSMAQYDRVLIVDTKQDDPLVSKTGTAIEELPNRTWYQQLHRYESSKKKPRGSWWRLVVKDDPIEARMQVHGALKRVYDEGNWIVFLDEIRDITDPKPPNINLGPWVDRLYRKGRSRRISVIAGTQSPAWVPRTFYDQASFAWIGRLRDEQRQKRLLEIGGMSRKALPILSSLERRQWLLAADNGEFFARTKVEGV
ncbi:MAG: type IV secretory system conjugative DNA transfer family protein [Candidatus Saccharimonadales bacterium]